MPAGLRFSEPHLLHLARMARCDPRLCGELAVKDSEVALKWHRRWVILYQNFLFCFEGPTCTKPLAVTFLEHSTADVLSPTKLKDIANQYCFYIAVPADTRIHKLYLRANNEEDFNTWLSALGQSNYATLALKKSELEARCQLLSQIVEAEQAAKWQCMMQCKEYEERVEFLEKHFETKKPRVEKTDSKDDVVIEEVESEGIQKIKKLQSVIRAWLCRRRWHSIVQNYIESGHAANIRQRNQLIFHFVQEEEEYVRDISTLVTVFLRPFRMAASAKKPPTTHEAVNSIFLNCEIILFLHQIFLKGLQTRMENWPTLILGDLFRVLLPMYGIYQEYVRNHHYSLETLADCKQSPSFNRLLRVHEEKPVCENRSLETFLTLPMHRVPGYIITLHRLLAFTPADHVDRPSLQHACSVLEDLSTLMHDEVSETENIRKNLSIERQIVGGCEELLDVEQVFIRQGSLIQVQEQQQKKLIPFAGLGIIPHERKENVRHCFLFSGLLLIATRSSNGKLHLHKGTGKLPLSDVTLLDHIANDEETLDAITPTPKTDSSYEEMALRVVVNPRDGESPLTITLVAQTSHEKEAWLSDLKQCIENVSVMDNPVDSNLPFSSRFSFANVREDPTLYTDDVNIKYSKCLNSCRVPRIRYASLERLFGRLLDLRFLSIEFLNTFLITYRIFTDAETLLEVLENFYHDRQRSSSLPLTNGDIYRIPVGRRTASLNERHVFVKDKQYNGFVNDTEPEEHDRSPERPTTLQIPQSCYHRRHSSPSALGEGDPYQFPSNAEDSKSDEDNEVFFATNSASSQASRPTASRGDRRRVKNSLDDSQIWRRSDCLNTGSVAKDDVCYQAMTSSGDGDPGTCNPADVVPLITMDTSENQAAQHIGDKAGGRKKEADGLHCGFALGLEQSTEVVRPEKRPNSCPKTVGKYNQERLTSARRLQESTSPKHSKSRSQSLLERRKNSKESKATSTPNELKSKRKFTFPRPISPRLQNANNAKALASPGAVVTSSRQSKRRTSITAAAAAFAAATAGAACSPSSPMSTHSRFSFREVQGPLARVLTVLHHWVLKHKQDFQNAATLQTKVEVFLDKVKESERTTIAQRTFCNTILKTLSKSGEKVTDERLFEKTFFCQVPRPLDSEVTFDKLSSNQIAEQLTLTEHILFSRIPSHEFLMQSWMKPDKEERAPNILRVSQRFNEVSRLVASEILCRSTASARAAAIEKWIVVADVCRHLSNFNAVLEIISALMSSSVYRLKKTWEKLSKQTKALIDKLQALVSTDGRFKNMREALRCSNPPCIPYLGFYLTDLAFIEEGTSVKNEQGLINFSKMRMIAQVVEEIRNYQEIRYNIQHDPKVTQYLFCKDILMDENSLYKISLTWEPKKRPSVRLKRGDSQDY